MISADSMNGGAAEEVIRRTYEQFVKTRNAQLGYVARTRRRRNAKFGTVLTPDLVVQYNYTYRLLKSLRGGLPIELCVEDGGATCSDLSVLDLDTDDARPVLDGCPKSRSVVADGSDYLGSRIVELFDRPVDVSDPDLTVKVRDDFAANIRILNQLFEERYRLCQEHTLRLRNEISTVRERLKSERADAASGLVVDRRIDDMRDQIARYEVQMRVVKEQLEALDDMNVNAVKRNRHEIDRLSRILADRPSHGEHVEAIVALLRRLVDNSKAERERIAAALKQIRPADVAADSGGGTSTSEDTTENTQEYNKRFQAAVETNFGTELASYLEDRIVREVDQRKTSLGVTLRERLDSELQRITSDLQNGYSDALADVIAQRLNKAIRVVTVKELPLSASPASSDGDIPENVKRVLDDIHKVKASVAVALNLKELSLNGVPSFDNEIAILNIVYYDLISILGKMRDIHLFTSLQNIYVGISGANAYRHYVPPPPLVAERTSAFKNRISAIVTTLNDTKAKRKQILQRMLDTIHRLLLNGRFGNDRPASETEDYKRGRDLEKIHKQAEKLVELYRTKRIDPVALTQRQELELLRGECLVKRSTVRELQQSLTATTNDGSKAGWAVYNRDTVTPLVARDAVKKEQTLRNDMTREFTKLYVELANLTIRLTDEFHEWSNTIAIDVSSETLREYSVTLHRILDEADTVVPFRTSPGFLGKK